MPAIVKKTIQRATALLSALCVAFVFLASCSSKDVENVFYSPYEHDFGEKIGVEISIEDYGTVKLELYPDVAPITVENFVSLAREGFYDGLIIHRVAAGFVIQGGSPNGSSVSDPKQPTIKGEFAANGVKNEISHVKGVISMARTSQSYNSATSQFFIMLSDQEQEGYLNGNYAAFGCVTEGMDIVEKLGEVEVYSGTDIPVEMIKIESIKIIEQS